MDHPWIRVSRDNPFQAATSQSAREHSGGSTHFQFLRGPESSEKTLFGGRLLSILGQPAREFSLKYSY